MMALIVCAVLVSLSDVFNPPIDEQAAAAGTDFIPKSEKTPVWAAVLASFVMPTVCTFFIFAIKYSD